MHQETKNIMWLTLLQYLLYCGGLQPNLYLQGVPPYPATAIIAQWAHEQNGYTREEGHAWAQQHELLLTMADVVVAAA